MPPWLASVPRSTSLLPPPRSIGSFLQRLNRHNTHTPKHGASPVLRIRSRGASTHVSPSAINYRPNIPPKNEELYNALSQLSGGSEEAYVNISRLQLALRGLSARDAVTRVAVLSLSSQRNAQKLARLLLADPLGSEEGWEKKLEGGGGGEEEEDGRAVLIRYGEESDPQTPSPLYRILPVPSRILRTHNLEILVSTLNVDTSNPPVTAATESSKDAVLVPKLEAVSSRALPVPYPVHKTLILGEGVDSAVAYGRFASDTTSEDLTNLVKVAIDLPPPAEEVQPDEQSASTAVNVNVGTEALASFRESISNSAIYERGWYRSGLPGLSSWLVNELEPSESVKPALRSLISSLIVDVEAKVTAEDALQLQKLAASVTPQQTSESIIAHLESWAEQSHTELRDQLDEAFAARNWHKLAWWKLFWRVDDVTMISSEILERRWLVDAEKNAIYLAGRMNQADFPEVLTHIPESLIPSDNTPEDSTSPATTINEKEAPSTPQQPPQTSLSTNISTPQPWPTQISTSRTLLTSTTIPPLQSLAQRLVLTTLSTTSLSSALSALLYVSVSSFSVFEASAIAALGLVFSLRRMQSVWEKARRGWEAEVREEGRRTLKGVEEGVRLIVRSEVERKKGGVVGEDEGVRERRRVREVVGRVREALGRV